MKGIINVDSLRAYREAVNILRKNNINYDKRRLLNNLSLCREIVMLMNYYDKKEEKVEL